MTDIQKIKQILKSSDIDFVSEVILNATGDKKYKEIFVPFKTKVGKLDGISIQFTLAGKLKDFAVMFNGWRTKDV